MSAAGDRLRKKADKADGPAGRAAADAMAKKGRALIQQRLKRRGHSAGTPTPSPPGQPPARISGRLAGSIVTTGTSGGGGVWRSGVSPRGVVYAAIQEHGGAAGRHHASILPPRPYMTMAGEQNLIGRAGDDAFHRVMGR